MVISEKVRCNFYNVGYCRNHDKGCKFFHPEESCYIENCDCKFYKFRSFCKRGENCQFKHVKNNTPENKNEKITDLEIKVVEKDQIIETLEETIAQLNGKIVEQDSLRASLDKVVASLKDAEKTIEAKNKEINAKNAAINEKVKQKTNSEAKIKELEQNLNDKRNELIKQVKRNEVIQNVLNKKNDDLKKYEEKHKEDQTNPYSCDACDFVGKNKAGLKRHMKLKHENESSVSKQNSESTNDEFSDEVNDFLKSVNYLNNSENNFPCDKCSLKFASKDFLDIHIGATHKIKCKVCDYETGHKDLLKEHIENPGIWHKS